MRIAALTSSLEGTAAEVLPALLRSTKHELCLILYNESRTPPSKAARRRMLKKLWAIGPIGAINGLRMRKWYGPLANAYLDEPSVDTFAASNGIPLRRVKSTRCEGLRKAIVEVRADLCLSLGNGYIPESVFTLPRLGTVNVHHEILPDYQNAQSVLWQLYNGSYQTGFTIHMINRHIDEGDILLKESIPIVFRDSLQDTVSYNYAQLIKASASGLVKVLDRFDHFRSTSIPQSHGRKYTTPSFLQYLRILRNFKAMRRVTAHCPSHSQ